MSDEDITHTFGNEEKPHMDFDIKYTVRRGNFIMTKNAMKEHFGGFPDVLITFVGNKRISKKNGKILKKHISEKYDEPVFNVYNGDEVFRMSFYEIDDEKIDGNVKNEFIEQIVPEIIEYLGNSEQHSSFWVKFVNGKLKIFQHCPNL